jgi:hypothetical protein
MRTVYIVIRGREFMDQEQHTFRELAWALGVLTNAQQLRLAQLHTELLHETSRLVALRDIIELYAACSRISSPGDTHAESSDP